MGYMILWVLLDAYCFLLPVFYAEVSCGFDSKNYERAHKTRQLKLIINCHLPPFISVSAIRKIFM